jgi:putative nucleotidyltransferase with HDIG domain
MRPERRLGILLLRAADAAFPAVRLELAQRLAEQATIVCAGQSGDAGSLAAVTALAAAIDARDDATHEHSREVVELAVAVGRRLGLAPCDVEQLRRAALLHDVGKVAIPNDILHEPGPLTEEQWRVMRRHPVIGEGILRRTPQLAEIAPLVRHAHERYDGAGYPDALAGDAIPLGSRIVLACDAYSAMTTQRPYRAALGHTAAVAELRASAETQLDPAVVAALLAVLDPDGGSEDYGVLISVAE